jgi:hypothetical protein
MYSTTTTTFQTFSAGLYDITSQGKVFVGKVQITIDPCDVNMNGLSSKFFMQDIVEIDKLPTFSIFDFPDTADLPNIDLQADNVLIPPTTSVLSSDTSCSVDGETYVTDNMADFGALDMIDFKAMGDTFDVLDFKDFATEDDIHSDQLQEEELLQEDINYDNEFVPINHPVSLAGVRVNRNGEIILQNDDEAAKTLRLRFVDCTNMNPDKRDKHLFLVSKENKEKLGPIVAFEVYRNNAWLKACDLHLPTEIVKRFLPQFHKLEIVVSHLDGDFSNCQLRNLVALIKDTNKVKPQPIDMIPSSSDWKQLKLWNGELLPKYYCSFAGQIAFIKDDKMSYFKIGSPNTCFSVKIMGLKHDARKVVWRTFTDRATVQSRTLQGSYDFNKRRQYSEV